MQENWSANQLKFIEWLAMPKSDRQPDTIELLAAQMGVNPVTLYRWKKQEGFQEAVNALARASVGSRLPEVYGALLREAEKGSFQHIKLTLELSGDYVEQSNVKHSGAVDVVVKGYVEVTPDDWDKDSADGHL
jgi:hypothetical protein